MTSEQFCYWLRGYFELSGTGTYALTHIQVKIIQDHLNLVFNKQTPLYAPGNTCFSSELSAMPVAANGLFSSDFLARAEKIC